ncbi:DeoR/GlpR transcriptional regulator [Salmonella enterica subsp. salamae serovar 47:z:e,n,x,z15]|nr:DeoR/GlpR transcriptional regulator [Salmonella enterica]EGZ3992383.1 DeoR/GlpR transcriptional regulator [Salmonella enterica subsp. enterica serovar Wichita]MBA2990318.1 DeoR/GlpR transcriptional regulator [Salmonella enterica subsp. salamae serovar 47:z:e,n,x,z15]EBO9257158.1 DeoR/GlpR transcriptional regulator [Salmonella enterica]EDE9644217.1 DeoR family transcriptional regulator [Salmonella enterica]
MAAKDRIQAIKQMVANDKKVTVSNLSSIFQVTEETIRRDLEKLEDEGFLTRTYGGAVLNSAVLADNIHFYKRAKSYYEEKQIIARNTLPFIKNKTTMAADSSSTVMELLKLLKDRSDLTLLTNSAEAFHELAQSDINLVSTGGELNKNTLSLQGRITKEIISRYHVDIMVMSCKGLDMTSGALDSNEAEAEIKKTMIRQATEVALLVDHSKFDRKAFVRLVDFSHIHYLITNKAPGDEWVAFCDKNNIQLVY